MEQILFYFILNKSELLIDGIKCVFDCGPIIEVTLIFTDIEFILFRKYSIFINGVGNWSGGGNRCVYPRFIWWRGIQGRCLALQLFLEDS